MADAQSNIKVSIDTAEALANIKNLQRQISAFHTSMAKGGAAANAVTAQMQQSLINSVNATGKFSAQMRTIRTTTESFTNALEKNKFSMGEYFRYAGGASKSFGRLFKSEFETINKVARENVKDLQTQYIKMGRDANGAMKAIAVRPLSLDMNDLATKTMIASEKQALLNQLLKQGSTNLLNFGKNTQWAGRQLMVGFTLPLVSLGAAASKTFMDMETQAIRFKKVYGDLFTPQAESDQALKDIQELGKEFTKYGIAVSSTVGLAAEAAAAGFKGVDLQRQTAAATKLSILGQVESQKALETTISLQNAFSMSSENLAESIDFLNAVENQTVLSLDDVSTAIPKAAPIVQQLGGDVKDLAFFMTAMKEGGINASEGANALKSGLASLINPTGKAAAMLEGFGINAKKIVVDNKGDLKKTVIEFATALNQLDPLNRAQAIEQMFGKFQFSRLSTLFANVTKEGTQAARVLDLAGSSVQELASLSEKELGMTSESAMNKFKGAVENLKLALVPVGEEFLKAVTPIAEFVTKILDRFNNLGEGTKKIIVTMTAIVAGLGPVLLMTFGLLANGVANIIKGFTAMKTLFNRTGQSSATLGTEVRYMTLEQRNAAAVAASLDQVHRNLAQTFTAEATSVDRLTAAYARSIAAQQGFMPTGIPLGRGPIKKRAKGKPAVVGGTGNQDSELAFLMPGETVIPTDMSKKYGSLINGMIADNIPGYEVGRPANESNSTYWTQEKRNQVLDSLGLTGRERVRIPLAGDTPTYSTSGVMAPASVNDTAAGMTSEFIKSPLGRAAYNENIRVGLEDAGVSATRISQIFDEVGPTLKDAIDKFDDTSGKWSQTAQSAMDQINKNPNITEAERLAIRKRIAPSNPEDYTVGSRRVLEVSRRRAVPRAERVNAPARYGSARQLARLKKQFPDTDFSGWEYSHMPGQASIPGQQANVAAPTIGTGVKGARGRALTQQELSMLAEERKKAEARASKSADGVIKKVKKTAGTASPSKRTIPVGEDIARGLAVGMKKETPKVVAAADRMTEAAVNATRKKGRSSRAQGPAPIGPDMPAGAKQLGIVSKPQQTRTQRLMAGAKGIGGRMNSLGGGVGLLGANMGLSMLPDFAGKGVAQGALAGANLGMMFGPQGMAAGAAVGLVTSAFSALIAKEKEHEANVKATFSASSEIISLFGDQVLDTSLKITNIIPDAKNLKDSLSAVSPEVQALVDSINKLPEDNAISKFVKNIAKDSVGIKSLTGSIRSQVSTAISTGGLDPKNAEKYVQAILAAANRTKDFGQVWKSVSKDVVDVQTATTTSFNKLDKAIKATGDSFFYPSRTIEQYGKKYDELNGVQKAFADQMLNMFSITSNGSLTFDQLRTRITAMGKSSVDAKVGVAALTAAINNTGNKDAIARLSQIKTMYKEAGMAAQLTAGQIMMANVALQLTTEDAIRSFANKKGMRRASKADQMNAYLKSDEFKKLYKSYQDIVTPDVPATTKDFQNLDDGKTKDKVTTEDLYLKVLQKEIDALKAKRDAQKDANDEVQRQIDLQMKMQDLANQATQAKISGNYIQAAMLGQESQNIKMKFNQETEIRKKDAEIAALEARYRAIKDGAKLTSSEKAKIPKKANGGLIKGPGTGRSDSIRATLGYAGGGSIRVSNGEFVVKAASVSDYGVGAMNAVNNGTASISTNGGGTVYNINMPITSNNASPEGVANEVMRRLKVEINKNNKSNRVNI
jgi:TP901 family phage tail tape measure protein